MFLLYYQQLKVIVDLVIHCVHHRNYSHVQVVKLEHTLYQNKCTIVKISQ